MAGKQSYSDEAILAALVDRKGLVSLAAKKLGCGPDTIYRRARTHPKVAACIASQRGEIIDTAEMRLFEAVERGDQWAVAMVLKTIGKSRGYVERTETRTVSDDEINSAIEAAIEVEVARRTTRPASSTLADAPVPPGRATDSRSDAGPVADRSADRHDVTGVADLGSCF